MYHVFEHTFEIFYICLLHTMNSFSLHIFMLYTICCSFFSVLHLRDEFKMLISVLAFVENISIFKLAFINYEDGSQGKITLLLIKL